MTVRKTVIRFCNNIRHFNNEINKHGGRIFLWRAEFFKICKRDFTFIREMKYLNTIKDQAKSMYLDRRGRQKF